MGRKKPKDFLHGGQLQEICHKLSSVRVRLVLIAEISVRKSLFCSFHFTCLEHHCGLDISLSGTQL